MVKRGFLHLLFVVAVCLHVLQASSICREAIALVQ